MYTQYSKITFETGILRIGREQDWHDGHMAGDTIGLWPGASARSPWPVPSEPRGTALLAGPAVSSEGPFFPHAFPIRPRSREQKQTSSVWMKMKRFTPAAEMGTWRFPRSDVPFKSFPLSREVGARHAECLPTGREFQRRRRRRSWSVSDFTASVFSLQTQANCFGGHIAKSVSGLNTQGLFSIFFKFLES